MSRTTKGDRAIAALARVRAVLDDFYNSDEPRSVSHALVAVRTAVDNGEALTCPACGADYAEADRKWRCVKCDGAHAASEPCPRNIGQEILDGLRELKPAPFPHFSSFDDLFGPVFRLRVVEVPEPFTVPPRAVQGTYQQKLPSIVADNWTVRVVFDPDQRHFAGAGAAARFVAAAAPAPKAGDTFTLSVGHEFFFKGVVT